MTTYTPTSHQITLANAGTYVVTYTASACTSGLSRPDLAAVRFNWVAATSPARNFGGNNSVSTGQNCYAVTISEVITVTATTMVRVEAAAGSATTNGTMQLNNPTLYSLQIR